MFIHAINVTVVAAWRVHCQFPDIKSHLTFRRDIARTLMKTPLDVKRTGMARDHRSNPPAAVRYDGTYHFAGKDVVESAPETQHCLAVDVKSDCTVNVTLCVETFIARRACPSLPKIKFEDTRTLLCD